MSGVPPPLYFFCTYTQLHYVPITVFIFTHTNNTYTTDAPRTNGAAINGGRLVVVTSVPPAVPVDFGIDGKKKRKKKKLPTEKCFQTGRTIACLFFFFMFTLDCTDGCFLQCDRHLHGYAPCDSHTHAHNMHLCLQLLAISDCTPILFFFSLSPLKGSCFETLTFM